MIIKIHKVWIYVVKALESAIFNDVSFFINKCVKLKKNI